MQKTVPTKAEVDALNEEYKTYIMRRRVELQAQYRVESKDVYEVMCPEDQALVHRRVQLLREDITNLAEAWWKERGFGVIWPDDDSKPMQVRWLGTT